MVGIVAILHPPVVYVRSVRGSKLLRKKKYTDVNKLMALVSFFLVIQLIGSTLTAFVHNVGPAIFYAEVRRK